MREWIVTDQFEEIQDTWEQLLPRCSTNNIFVTPWLQQVWWQNFGDDLELRIHSLWGGDSPIGIAPLALDRGVFRFVGGRDLFDYHDFLILRGEEAMFLEALFVQLGFDEDWQALELLSVPQDSPTLQLLPPIAMKQGYDVIVEEEDKAPVKQLPNSWDEYLGGLTKKKRHELRRKIRRLEGNGTFRQFELRDVESIQEVMPDFLRLHRGSSPEKARFMNKKREKFFLDMATELGGRGQFNVAVLEFDGSRVATCINLEYEGTHFLYNSGYDPAYAHLGVGFVNKALAVKESIKAGQHSFDFLRGSERYKYDLGAEDRSVFKVSVTRRR